MTIIDLTHPITEDMPVYPGGDQPSLTQAATLEKQGFRETRLCLCSHNGTHVDAPAHLLPAGATLERYPPERFVGSGFAVDCRLGREQMRAALESPAGRKAQFVLFCTGHSSLWGREGYFAGWPVPPPDILRLLAGRGAKGVGIDALSIDPANDTGMENHRILLEAGTLIFENLTDLERLPPSGFAFVAPPLPYPGADGAPVRAWAVVEP